MGRPKFDVRITFKSRGGKANRLEVVRLLDGRFQVWINGKRSAKTPVATTTEICNRLRHWLSQQAKP